MIFERLKDSAAEQAQRKADEEKKQLKDKHRKQRLTWKSQIELEKKARVATVDELFREEKRRQEADEQLSSMKQRETRMLESWVVASAHYETRANSAIDWLVYGALTAVATVGFVAAIMDIYPYYTSTVGAAATLIGVLIAVGEKTKLMPRVGRRRVFEKKVRFISERAKEAGRDDLLERIMVDHLAMTIGLEDPK